MDDITSMRVQQIIAILSAPTYVIQSSALAVRLYATPQYWTQPYHTSILQGAVWVKELINRHPQHIWTELGVQLHVFELLVLEVKALGVGDRRYVFVEEQVAIFLYMCVTGLFLHHTRERFQHANDTISKFVDNIFQNNIFINGLIFCSYSQHSDKPRVLQQICFSS